MESIRVAAAQFEMKNGDKEFNLAPMGRKHLAAGRPDLCLDILGASNPKAVIDPSWDVEK